MTAGLDLLVEVLTIGAELDALEVDASEMVWHDPLCFTVNPYMHPEIRLTVSWDQVLWTSQAAANNSVVCTSPPERSRVSVGHA